MSTTTPRYDAILAECVQYLETEFDFRPGEINAIAVFMANDVDETSDPEGWNGSDIQIAFGRFLIHANESFLRLATEKTAADFAEESDGISVELHRRIQNAPNGNFNEAVYHTPVGGETLELTGMLDGRIIFGENMAGDYVTIKPKNLDIRKLNDVLFAIEDGLLPLEV